MFRSTRGIDVGRQELELREERRRDVARPLARAGAWHDAAEHRTLRIGDDVAVVGGRPAGADSALHHQPVLKARIGTEVHAVPVLGLLAEVAGKRRIGRALTRLRRIDVVEPVDPIAAAVGQPGCRAVPSRCTGRSRPPSAPGSGSPGSCRTSAGSSRRRCRGAAPARAARSSRTPSCTAGCPTRIACPR